MSSRSSLVLESPKNARVQEWKRLATPRGRAESGLFLAEGPHLVEEAARAGCLVELIAEADAAVDFTVPTILVSRGVMKAIAETPSPQGMIGVCRIDQLPTTNTTDHWLILDGVQDPGNVGTMIRTAHAAGFGGVGIATGTADPLSGKALRASQGSVFHIGMQRGGALDMLNDLQHADYVLVGSALSPGARGHDWLRDVVSPVALIVGNEGAGVSPAVLDHCNELVRIEMPGGAESLSVPVAAGILMFQLVHTNRIRNRKD